MALAPVHLAILKSDRNEVFARLVKNRHLSMRQCLKFEKRNCSVAFNTRLVSQWPAAKVAVKMDVKIGKVYFATYKISRLLKKEIKRLEAKWV